MQVEQTVIRGPLSAASAERWPLPDADLVLVFGSVAHLQTPGFAQALSARYARAVIAGCSTAGEVSAEGVEDGSCNITAVRLDHTRLVCAHTRVDGVLDSHAAGVRVAQALACPGLQSVLVFGPGVDINGSAMVDGIGSVLGQALPVTGGLAGDAGAFVRTHTLGPTGVDDRQLVAVGFVGERIRIGHGTYGGWIPFGPAREVTRAAGNILYELDGEPALSIYKRYLGEHAKDLPGSGLLFPFAVLNHIHDEIGLIRTILGVDEAAGSLILAGSIEQGGFLKLMQASTDRLISGAERAAEAAMAMTNEDAPTLAVLVSCVGRKLVMGPRVEEEVEAVGAVLGGSTVLSGFYSNGEISPALPGVACNLHNQTMTITTFREA